MEKEIGLAAAARASGGREAVAREAAAVAQTAAARQVAAERLAGKMVLDLLRCDERSRSPPGSGCLNCKAPIGSMITLALRAVRGRS